MGNSHWIPLRAFPLRVISKNLGYLLLFQPTYTTNTLNFGLIPPLGKVRHRLAL